MVFTSSVQSGLGSPPVQAAHDPVPVSVSPPNFGLLGLKETAASVSPPVEASSLGAMVQCLVNLLADN